MACCPSEPWSHRADCQRRAGSNNADTFSTRRREAGAAGGPRASWAPLALPLAIGRGVAGHHARRYPQIATQSQKLLNAAQRQVAHYAAGGAAKSLSQLLHKTAPTASMLGFAALRRKPRRWRKSCRGRERGAPMRDDRSRPYRVARSSQRLEPAFTGDARDEHRLRFLPEQAIDQFRAEVIESGASLTPFMNFDDTVQMRALLPDGSAPFGAIEQRVVKCS